MLARARWVGAVLLLTTLALAGVLAWESTQADRLAPLAATYAATSFGPGLGSSMSFDWSTRHLDPGLERGSNCDLYPVPGLPGFCPDQGTGLYSPPDDGHGLPRLVPAPTQ